jgi:hypothetical protein
MDIQDFVDSASNEMLEARIWQLAENGSPDSLQTLEEFLFCDSKRSKNEKGEVTSRSLILIPRYLATLALLQIGSAGVESLAHGLTQFLSSNLVSDLGRDIFGVIWWAARGKLRGPGVVQFFQWQPRCSEFTRPLTDECVRAARNAVGRLIIDARTDAKLFECVLGFLISGYDQSRSGGEGVHLDEIYDTIMSGAIKLSRALLEEFRDLIHEQRREEDYQAFLKKNPVFLDPLAADVIPKQKFGLEVVTDFVIQRYDNKYILVEIEKPHDPIFIKSRARKKENRVGDFSAEFTHAFGQVLEFQEWVESNGAYANKHMPGISSPRGLLVIGRRSNLSPEERNQLHRFSVNSAAIDVMTFDDVLGNATSLYELILRKGDTARATAPKA